jgi:thymidylate synthase (FAD)
MSIPNQHKPITTTSAGNGTAKYFLLDGTGFVERLETFGNDLTVVNAARVSFAKESHTLDERDAKLIRYLARHNHITPFFHPQVRFRLKMPIFVAREWFRHTIGFSRNEVSRRYVDSRPECWVPVGGIRERDAKAKQGSKDTFIAANNEAIGLISNFQETAVNFYEDLLKLGVAPEVARGVLPQSMYTEFIETGSLYAYARLCKLRLDPHAQKEIRDYADAIARCLQGAFPVSWAALMENVWDVAEPAPAIAVTNQPLIETPTVAPVAVQEHSPEFIPAPPSYPPRAFPISVDMELPAIEITIDSTLRQLQELQVHPWGC